MTRTMEAAGVMVVVLIMAALARAYDSIELDEYFLEEHNKARRAVGVLNLQWCQVLENKAVEYAYSEYGCAESNPANGNVYYNSNPVGFKDAMPEWLHAKQYYKIVFKDYLFMGCDYYRCGNGGRFVVCFYDVNLLSCP